MALLGSLPIFRLAVLAGFFPALTTALGGLPVFGMARISERTQAVLLGFVLMRVLDVALE